MKESRSRDPGAAFFSTEIEIRLLMSGRVAWASSFPRPEVARSRLYGLRIRRHCRLDEAPDFRQAGAAICAGAEFCA